MLKYKSLGKSGIEVSPMAVGCWAFGGGSYWGDQSQADVNAVVARSLDTGVNFFDTAALYNAGESERSLAASLGSKRKDAIICSKFGPDSAYYDSVIAGCEASLRRLNTDYLDIFMLHWPINTPSIRHFAPNDEQKVLHPPVIEETMAALEKLKKDGKIRGIGVSNFGVQQLTEAIATGVQIDVNEMTYNIFSRAIETAILPLCIDNNIAVVGSMALQQGLLTGKYASADDVPMNQAHSRHYANERGMGTSRHGCPGAEAEMFAALEELKLIAAECNTTMAKLAIAWTLHKPGIVSSLVGSRNVGQFQENYDGISLALDRSIVEKIDRISQPVFDLLGSCPDYYENEKNSRIY